MKERMVWGEGPTPCKLMLVGEAPAEEECRRGKPFVGKSGQELVMYLDRYLGLSRNEVYITNLSKVPLDRSKEIFDLGMMGEMLQNEIYDVQPDIIMTLGAISSYWFLRDAPHDMEVINAISHAWEDKIIIPSFHPAAAFHDTELMQWIGEAFSVVNDALNGKVEVWKPGPITICYDNIEDVAGGEIWALDTETMKDGRPYCVTATSHEGRAAIIKATDQAGLTKLKSLLSTAEKVVLHNAMFDLLVLECMGIEVKNYTDTMQIAFLLQTLPLGLKGLAYRLAGMKMKEYKEVIGDGDWDTIEERTAWQYACEDADATLRVYNRMLPSWYLHMDEILQRDLDVMPMVRAMMQRGMKINKQYLQELECELMIRNMELQTKIEDIAWEGFNPASAPQNAKLLYQKLGLGKRARIKRTKWGGSTDTESLARIKHEHPVVEMITDWKETDTLIDKFISVLPKMADEDNRIHTDISMVRVKHSGRLASSKPNLMAQPTRTSDGRRIRDAFEASKGYNLWSFDYNQIEMRLMAHLSQDEKMCRMYMEDKDVHTNTAMWIFGISDPRDVDEMKHRYPSKRTGFGVINFVSARGLSNELTKEGAEGWTEDKCQEMLDAWFKIFKGIKAYMEKRARLTMRTGKAVDIWGRMEYIPEIYSAFPHIVDAGIRKAGNQDIQSGAQGIIKEAMHQLWPMAKEWVEEGTAYPLLQIHDDLLWEIKEGEEWTTEIIRTVMMSAVSLSIPLKVNMKKGKTWGSVK